MYDWIILWWELWCDILSLMGICNAKMLFIKKWLYIDCHNNGLFGHQLLIFFLIISISLVYLIPLNEVLFSKLIGCFFLECSSHLRNYTCERVTLH